jgi:predicted enzyme related to lactoylglutathione lyase
VSLFRGINVVSITVPDFVAAKRFYGETLGLGPPTYDLPDMGWIEFNTGANGGALSLTPAEDEFIPSTNVTVVLNVESCAEAVATLRERGVRCDDPVGVPGMVTYANIYDPWGNRLQVCSAPPA